MTQIDFYILHEGSRERIACRLIEKIYSQGKRIYVHTESEQQATQLDELLWTFRDGSFIPHERYQPGNATESPIQIGTHQAPETDSEVLINLTADVPLFFSHFLRVAELVAPNDTDRAQGRARFRFYRDRGYSLNTHDLK